MNDAFVVRRLECFRDLPREGQCFFEWRRSRSDALGQRLALDVLHHEVVGSHVVQRVQICASTPPHSELLVQTGR